MINLKKIFCWPPLLAGVGAAVTIGILAYMTYQTELGLWLLASFGATTVIVFGYHNICIIGLNVLMERNISISAVFTHRDNPDENIWFKSVSDYCEKKGFCLESLCLFAK